MSVKILYFASLKEALGMGGESVELPAGVTTVGALRDWLVRGRISGNLVTGLDAPVREGDEIAFFPPVTGG